MGVKLNQSQKDLLFKVIMENQLIPYLKFGQCLEGALFPIFFDQLLLKISQAVIGLSIVDEDLQKTLAKGRNVIVETNRLLSDIESLFNFTFSISEKRLLTLLLKDFDGSNVSVLIGMIKESAGAILVQKIREELKKAVSEPLSVFNKFDQNRVNKLSHSQFTEMLNYISIRHLDAQERLIKVFDPQNTGFITIEKYSAIIGIQKGILFHSPF